MRKGCVLFVHPEAKRKSRVTGKRLGQVGSMFSVLYRVNGFERQRARFRTPRWYKKSEITFEMCDACVRNARHRKTPREKKKQKRERYASPTSSNVRTRNVYFWNLSPCVIKYTRQSFQRNQIREGRSMPPTILEERNCSTWSIVIEENPYHQRRIMKLRKEFQKIRPIQSS